MAGDQGVIDRLAEDGCAAVRYRTLRDIRRLEPSHPRVAAAAREVEAYGPALKVAAEQHPDGTWAGRLHTGDSLLGVRLTTEIQFPRLAEYGWGPEHPAVKRTAALLLRFLESEDLGLFPDIAAYVKGPRRRRYFTHFTRSICAGMLAHAGLGDHPAVVQAARELLAAAHRFVTGPAAGRPVAGNPPFVVAEAFDAELGYPAIPDVYLLQLLAHCPAAMSGDGRRQAAAVLDYALGPAYQALEQRLGHVSAEGQPFVKGWKIELPPPEQLAAMGRWGYGLIVLEMVARVAPLSRLPQLERHLEWLRRWRRPDGFYDLPALSLVARTTGPFAERVQLEPDWRTPARRTSDVTFRVRLIQTLGGWGE